MGSSSIPVSASIVLCDQSRTDLSAYGYRSWMLQDTTQPYEVIVNIFNPNRAVFEKLSEGRNPNCRVVLKTYDPPPVFNISAANNLGLHFAQGKYVIFANADIVHPTTHVRRITEEMERRQLHYMIGSRANLTPTRTEALRKPEEYTMDKNFDYLTGTEFFKELPRGNGLSPWIVSREAAFAVGGFDSNVYCHEDEEFNDRVMHYLRRTGQQQILYCMFDTVGYHLHHKPSEIHAMGPSSRKVYEPRRLRLDADPQSTEDVVPTPLDSLEALKDIWDKSKSPAIPMNKVAREVMPVWMRISLKRMKMANRVLWKGHL